MNILQNTFRSFKQNSEKFVPEALNCFGRNCSCTNSTDWGVCNKLTLFNIYVNEMGNGGSNSSLLMTR
jgi:hypothetical protein